MKFLAIVSLFASVAAMAQPGPRGLTAKCWDTVQSRRGYPTYVFGIDFYNHPFTDNIRLTLEHPRHINYFERKHDCWVVKGAPTFDPNQYDYFKVCLGEGQHINGLVPVEVDEEYFEGTVYCERDIKKAFEYYHGGTSTGGNGGGSTTGGWSGGTTGGHGGATTGGWSGQTSGGTSGGF